MKLRLFGPGGRVWRLAFRIKHTAKSLKYRQLDTIEGGGGGKIKRVKTTKNVKKKGDHKVDFLKLSVVPAATIFLTELMR